MQKVRNIDLQFCCQMLSFIGVIVKTDPEYSVLDMRFYHFNLDIIFEVIIIIFLLRVFQQRGRNKTLDSYLYKVTF